MEQLTQNLKDGFMQLLEVPFPALGKGQVMVRNHYSVISAGTEGKRVKDARMGYIGKARARKDDVKKVIQTARTFGLRNTYDMVMNKLNAPSALGYSCAGEVIAVADDVKEFSVGDFVACGGNTAVHAEVVSVPKNLCVKVPKSVNLEHAAYATIGSIALQGVRQADLQLGESCAVIGLGLVGQFTIQLLEAAGVSVCGVDIDPEMIALAQKNSDSLALNRSQEDIEQQINAFSGGQGVDAVIITAGTSSTDPVNLAGALCRKKGKVVIVGGVPTGFDRPNYFKKELDLRMSASYGPGRYDAEYEEKGHDYPIGYVRWTEGRNMQAIVDLIAKGQLDMPSLTTHAYDFDNAKEAYQLIVDKQVPFLGITLAYDTSKTLNTSVQLNTNTPGKSTRNVGVIGAGSFAQNFLLPALSPVAKLHAVATASGNNARNVADKYGFTQCAATASELIQNQAISTVFVVTRHDTHGPFVLEAIKAGKHVFVEKPLCLTSEQLDAIKAAYARQNVHVMVGFNRRFAPLTQQMMQAIDSSLPKAINYRVNAGTVPANHWIHDPEIGGGRIIGEGCHFIDLAMFIAGSPITSVSARKVKDANNLEDSVVIQMDFDNGSVANICYFSNGNKQLNKEYLEVFCGGVVARLEDFKTLTIDGAKRQKKALREMDKGYHKELVEFMDAIEKGTPAPILFDEICLSMEATFAAISSMRQKGERIPL